MQNQAPRDSRTPREYDEPRERRDAREQRSQREYNEPRERREQRDPRDQRESRSQSSQRGPKSRTGSGSGASNSAVAAKRAALRQKSKKLDVAIASLAAVLVVSIVVALFLPGFLAADPSLPVPSGSSTPEDYNKDANAIPLADLQGTVLSETADAGVEYVEETLFIGDSNTARMMSYYDITNVTLENGIGVERMGIDGLTNFNCVKFEGYSSLVDIPTAVKIMQPRRIVVMLGTNNASGSNTDAFIAKYEAGLTAVYEAYPYCDVIIAAIPPIAQQQVSNASMTTIDKYNLALAELAEKMGFKFLNWTDVLKDSTTGLCKKGYLLDDGIHLNQEAMKVMFPYFRTHSYITEDRRPMPLEPVPERGETPPGLIAADPLPGTSSSKTVSSSTSSSSTSGTVNVAFRVSDTGGGAKGGTISVNGQNASSVTIQVAPKGTVPDAVAIPADGYRFVVWRCSIGSIPNDTSTTLSGFGVYGTLKAGETLEVVAVFEAIPTATSSNTTPTSSTPPVPSSSEPVPSSSEPVISVPEPSSAEGAEGGG